MSKLDDIVNGHAFYQEDEFNRNTLKTEFKDLFNELIKDMDAIRIIDAPDENTMFEQMEREQYRYNLLLEAKLKLCQKVADL